MKRLKILNIITVLIILLFGIATPSFAAYDKGGGTVTSQSISTEYYKPTDLQSGDYEEAFRLGGAIVSTLRIIGIVIAVAGLMIIGIKYMISSVEQKAEYKKTMIPYLVGCILIFAITTIVSIIYELSSQF